MMPVSSSLWLLKSRAHLMPCLGIIILALLHHYSSLVSCETMDIWSKYRPLAMDESWSYVTSRPGFEETLQSNWKPRPPEEVIVTSAPQIVYPNEGEMQSYVGIARTENRPSILDVDQWQGKNVKDSLFQLPRTETSSLTKLIAGRAEGPTFLDNKIHKPTWVSPDSTKDKVLARYKVVIPIFIPAVKKKVISTVAPKVRFVTEQTTELIPVKNIVPHVKEVIKAEPVPQKLITDYVQANGNNVPSNVDDKVKLNDRIISSVVQNVK